MRWDVVDCGSIQPTGAVGDTEDAEARPAVDWLDQVSLATHGRLEHLFEQLLPDPPEAHQDDPELRRYTM